MVRRLASVIVATVVLVATQALAGAWADVDPGMPVPGPPSITASGESVIVSWTPQAGADGYRVQVSLNGGAYVDAGTTDGATYSLSVDDLRTPSLPCGQGPCSVTAEVAAMSGVFQSRFSAPSVAVTLPLPYSIPMSVARHDTAGQVRLVLYGPPIQGGPVVHLLMMSADQVWQDTGRTARVRIQRVPGHRHLVRAWLFTIVVRARGLSNYRVETPADGPHGEGMSRAYGVRR